ncbi:MAG: zinc ribbon domain-containing protein [Prevotella sp.]|nr:zinc ribbon domain-containing protein [Prevotella sp.]
MIIKCPECGRQVSDRAKTCPGCGVDIAGNVTTCQSCGATVFSDQEMCPVCHAMLAGTQTANRDTVVAQDVMTAKETLDNSDGANGSKNGGKKKRTAVWVIVVALVVTLSVVFGGLYLYQNMERHNEEEAYLNALASNEPSVLQNYLDIYGGRAPQEHIDSVEVYLDRFKEMDKEWNDAKVSRSRTALERYLKMHPGSVHEPEAKIMIDSIDWVVATLADTQDSYQRYMNGHPDGMHYDEAVQQYDKKAEEIRHAADTLTVSDMTNSADNTKPKKLEE